MKVKASLKGKSNYNYSTDDTQNHINLKNTQKKTDKVSYLPDIKVNIILEANQKNKNDSDDSDNEINVNIDIIDFRKEI